MWTARRLLLICAFVVPCAARVPPRITSADLSCGRRFALGINDFASFYVGGRLCGSPDLYNRERGLVEQAEANGYVSPTMPVVRWPCFALAFYPLARLPYRTAYALFQALSISAVLIYISLAAARGFRWQAFLACALSFPLFVSIWGGQDVTFVLLFVAVALRYWHRKPAIAGVALALCSLKYHLFLFVPVIVILARRRRLVLALVLTEAFLFGVSFLVAGLSWPIQYIRQLRTNWDNPVVMPNIRAVTLHWTHPEAWLIGLTAVLAIATVVALIRVRANHAASFAVALTAGLLATPHVYVSDCAILIPPMVELFRIARNRWLTVLTLSLLAPIPYFLRLRTESSFTYLLQLLFVTFVLCVVWCNLPARGDPRTRNGLVL